MKKLIIIITVLMLQSCAVFMAANQPGKKDVELFGVGIHRSALLAEFGHPLSSSERDGKTYEVFSFIQGYSTGAKVGRAVTHGVLDLFTLGLWEIVGTPTEAIFDGDKVVFEVAYDDNDNVTDVIKLKE